MNRQIDARHVLPAIHLPTLIMQKVGDPAVTLEDARYLLQISPEPSTSNFPESIMGRWPTH